MENKLQELTKKLYDEGLSKGRQEADTLLSDARQQAKQIVSEAEDQAEQILRKARKEAEDLHKNTLTEVSLAGNQMIGTLKSKVAGLIVEHTANDSVSAAMLDQQFIKELLLAVASGWQGSSAEKVSLSVMLPASQEKELSQALETAVKKELDGGMDIEFSERVKSGFKIGPKDGGYYIDFSEQSFNALLGEYLRPKVSGILFGKEKEQ